MKKVSLFIQEQLARLSGDTNKVIATRNESRIRAGIDQQIGSLKAKLIEDGIAIDTANDELHNVKYPTTEITDVMGYMQRVLDYEKRVKEAQKNKETTQTSLEYWEKARKEWFVEVEEK